MYKLNSNIKQSIRLVSISGSESQRYVTFRKDESFIPQPYLLGWIFKIFAAHNIHERRFNMIQNFIAFTLTSVQN